MSDTPSHRYSLRARSSSSASSSPSISRRKPRSSSTTPSAKPSITNDESDKVRTFLKENDGSSDSSPSQKRGRSKSTKVSSVKDAPEDESKYSKKSKSFEPTEEKESSITVLVSVFILAVCCLYAVYLTAPEFTAEYVLNCYRFPNEVINEAVLWFRQRGQLKYPRTLDDVKALTRLLTTFMQSHYYNVMIAFVVVYVFLQTFAVPGSIMLSVLGGALFGLPIGLLLVCTCSAIGASNCYFISKFFGAPLVRKYLKSRVNSWKIQVAQQRDHLFSYILFLRITPFLPNWFINIASPHLKIPIYTFFFGTFFGVAPPSFIHVQAGKAIQQLSTNHSVSMLTPTNVAAITIFAVLSILPVILKRNKGTPVA
ncbi:snare associated Golgi protein-domain-containing protein [Paraphysoderma sedebokerense]|nr:snare associated Golgi protein-domain-containing protein [Paraphysoderma sedebokerense]